MHMCAYSLLSLSFQALLLWGLLTPSLLSYWRWAERRWLRPLAAPPLCMGLAAPCGCGIDPAVYLPPALRPGALGWYPEVGKVWEKYNVPKYYGLPVQHQGGRKQQDGCFAAA